MILTLAGAVLIVAGFFLPWLQGDGVFAMRTFSGFDFATVAHNVVRGMAVSSTQSLAPALFYFAPAAAIGVASYATLAPGSGPGRLAALTVGCYTLCLVIAALVLALTPISQATRLLGPPSWGLMVTALGALTLVVAATRSMTAGAG